MKKRVWIWFLCGILSVTAFGCGRKSVDYDPDAEKTGVESEKETDSESDLNGKSDMGAESKEGTFYTEGIKTALGVESEIHEEIATIDGKRLSIYGDVIVPDVQAMQVYRTTARTMDTELKKQIVDAWSDDGVLYSAAEEQLPKSALLMRIYDCVEQRTILEEMDEIERDPEASASWLSEVREQLSYYEDLYAKAGENYQKITYDAWSDDGGSAVIMHEGVPYYITVNGTRISCYAVDYMSLLSELQTDCTAVSGEVTYGESRLPDDEAREQIEQAAEQFAQTISAGAFSVDDFTDVKYASFKLYKEEGEETEQYDSGYYVRLCRMLDGAKVDASNYSGLYIYKMDEESGEQDMLAYHPLESMNVILDESYCVIGFEYDSPIIMPEIDTAQVPLLSYATVKDILLKDLAETPVADGGGFITNELQVTYNFVYNYSDLELVYFRMENPEKKGEYLLIPAWRLRVSKTSSFPENACLINAIDGSRINIADEVYSWTEVDETEE